jgi:hypothetical protein
MINNTSVEFEGERQANVQNYYSEPPKTIQWIVKHSGGLIKNEKSASYVLLGVSVLMIVISLFLFFGGTGAEVPTGALKNPTYGLPIKD